MYDIPEGFTNCNDNEHVNALKTSTFIEFICKNISQVSYNKQNKANGTPLVKE